ncbi:MAG: response regulator [Gammaproteobacteria bacterium]
MQPRVATSWKRLSDDASSSSADSISHYSPSPPRMGAREAQLQRWETDGGKTALARVQVRILIVDNDTGAAESLEHMLHASGFSETQVAYSGHAAIALAAEFRPDVVLLDLGLYDMTAYQLAKSLREQAQSTEIRLIALTSSREHTAREQARAAGFERYLLKPIAAVDLSALLERSFR